MLNSGAILGFPGEINKASSTLVNSYVKLEAAPEVLTGDEPHEHDAWNDFLCFSPVLDASHLLTTIYGKNETDSVMHFMHVMHK